MSAESVTISEDVLHRYYRFTLYNSPFVAHDQGRAIDLYPSNDPVPSPVAGTVTETRQVRAPPKPYAVEHDYLILVDTGEWIARLLHVDPAVEPGDRIAVGDPLGESVRVGFFAPWVPNHIHLGFRPDDADPYRASGSVPIALGAQPHGLSWNGTGTVRAAGETWARLDRPTHPAPGERFVGLESGGGVLDGGFPHYDAGGLLGGGTTAAIAGRTVGTVEGREVTWGNWTVNANGAPVRGIALFCARDRFGIKLVGEDLELAVGDRVSVTIDGE